MKKEFLPIILGSDENAYGNVRLICEKYSVNPLLLCRKLLIPTMYSKLFAVRLKSDDSKSRINVSTVNFLFSLSIILFMALVSSPASCNSDKERKCPPC